MTTQVEAASKAAILLEALPYIRAWRSRTIVVKIGGQALEDADLTALVAEDLALLTLVGVRVVVVHGGGPQVSEAMRSAGIEPTFVGGRRVTDDRSIEIARRVLLGSINNDLVASLGAAGMRAVGLSGADDGSLGATRLAGGLGHVGEVTSVRADLVSVLLDEGFTPVVASIAPGADGSPLNINADEVAGSLAIALGAEKLVFLTNVDGLYADLGDEGSLISELKSGELREMVAGLSDGMRPKATAIVTALEAGVGKAHILDGRVPHALLLEIFTHEGIGTQVLP